MQEWKYVFLIILHRFRKALSIGLLFPMIGQQFVNHAVGHFYLLTFLLLTINQGTVFLDFKHAVGLPVGRKMAEVGRGRCHSHAILCRCEMNVDALFGLNNHRRETAFLPHLGIILRAPRDKIFAIGGGKAWRMVVYLEYRPPRTVFSMVDKG